MSGPGHRARAAFAALVLATGCEAVTGVADAGDGADDAGAVVDAAQNRADGEPPPPGSVTVQLFDGVGEPVSGASVVFTRPNGTVLAEQITGPDGVAEASGIPAGSSVTTAQTRLEEPSGGARHTLNTVVGVLPGDAIQIGPRTPAPPPTPMGALLLDMTTSIASSSSYEAHVGCDVFFPVVMPGVNNIPLVATECNRDLRPVEVLLLAFGDDSSPLAYQDLRGIALDSDPVDANEWTTTFGDYVVKLEDPPSDMAGATIELGLFARGLDYGFERIDLGTPPVGGQFEHRFQVPRELPELVRPEVQIEYGQGAGGSGFAILSTVDTNSSGQLDLPLIDQLPARVLDAELLRAGDDMMLRFTRSAPTNGMDAGGAGVRWRGDAGSPDKTTWEWNIMMPPGISAPVQLPTLPSNIVRDPATDAAAWPPPPAAELVEVAVGFLETTLIEDYAEFRRNRGFSLFDDALPASEARPGDVARVTVGGAFENGPDPAVAPLR